LPDSRFDRPLVVDANIVIGALLRDGTTRHILLSGGLDLHAPEALWDELDRNRAYLLEKSGATEAAYQLLMELLRTKNTSVPVEVLREKIGEALARLDPKDSLDTPYLAAAIAIGGTLWSHDKRLSRTGRVPNVRTRDVLAHLGM
jgi:predicted nucleic acid-binding protein